MLFIGHIGMWLSLVEHYVRDVGPQVQILSSRPKTANKSHYYAVCFFIAKFEQK